MTTPTLHVPRRMSIETGFTMFYGIAIAVVSCLRYRNYWAGSLDIAIFDQAAWRIAHGHATVSVIGRNIFFDHLSVVMVVFAGFYKLIASVYVLLIAQAIVLALMLPALRRLALHFGFSGRGGMLLGAIYAPTLAAAWFDFHPYTLGATALAWTLVGIVEDKRRLTVIMCVMVIVCRADLGLALLAVAAVAPQGRRRVPLFVGSAGLLTSVVVAAFSPTPSTWSWHYSYLGAGPAQALSHPWHLFGGAIITAALFSLIAWIVPLGFLPLLAPRWLLGIVIAESPVLLSQADTLHAPWFHYGVLAGPFALCGLFSASRHFGNTMRLLRVWLCSTIVISAITVSPFAPGAPPEFRATSVVRANRSADYNAILKSIPKDVAVAAVDPIGAHLAQRTYFYPYPAPFFDTGVIGPPKSAANAARISIVVVETGDLASAQSLGFTTVVMTSGNLVVLRRPT